MRWISPWILAGSIAFFSWAPAFAEGESGSSNVGNPDDDIRSVAVGTFDLIELDFTPAPNPAVGNRNILEVQPGSNPRELKVNPIKKGTTSVLIANEQGKIMRKIVYSIITNDLSVKVQTIRRLLQDIEGISIYSTDDKIVIDGELVVPRDLDRILQVQDAYKDVVFNLVTLSKISREAISRRMQKEINDDPGGVNVSVRIINDTFFLFGKVDSSADRERAETIAQTYLPELMGSPAIRENVLTPGAKKSSIKNMIVVEAPPPSPDPKMVRITYHFVEIGKEYIKSSFFKWTPLLTEQSGLSIGQSTAGGTAANGSFVGQITSLVPKLQSGANGGFVRVLFSTVQLAEDGQDVELVRQDEIPYIGAVVNGVPVPENQKVGVTIKSAPQIMGDQKVRLATTLTFSAFAGNGAGGKPRVTTTSMKNQIILKSGDSAALGGLISSDTAKDIDKDPESGAGGAATTGNPLFALLRSKSFRNKKSQFVVFLTPKIVEDAAEGTADIKAKILNNSTKKRRRVVH